MLESISAPGAATPRHTHAEDELFFIIAGWPTFLIGDELFEVGPGGTVLIPGGTVHAWSNRSSEPVRMTATFVPGGIERLFTEIAGLSPAQIAAKAAEYGTVVVGPPIGR